MDAGVPHLPAIRLGQVYESLDWIDVLHHRTGEKVGTVSQVNAGIIRRDLKRMDEAQDALKSFKVSELVELSKIAGEYFLNGTLPLGNKGHKQGPEGYVQTLSNTSGLTHGMVRRNMEKIHYALTHMGQILNGLMRGLPWEVIDRGYGDQCGIPVSYYPTTQALGLVMPSNSPAVNSLWLPAIALRTPVIIKPGREEPWTPYRLIQAFLAAGVPAKAFGFYPSDHSGATDLLRLSGRALVFGDAATVEQYRDQPKYSVHGPGYSKIVIGEDCIERWQEFLDVMVASISDNGGRSCVNASAIVVPRYGAEIADALAQRLAKFVPKSPEDPEARLSGFANPKMAEFINAAIEDGLQESGVEDVTKRYRGGERKVELSGGVYLCPTIVRCDSFNHPLANREFLCPYASVVEVPQNEVLQKIGPSLVVSAITKDAKFVEQLMNSSLIERLNLGPVPTTKISWDQPHEGNMFEFLYRRRSIETCWEPDASV